MKNEKSRDLFERAQQYIPGGVNSPVRAFKGVGGNPLFFKAGEGPYLIDVDDNRYIDYVGAWGPLILGHSHPGVIEALQLQLEQGLAYGASTAAEVEIAKKICELVPSIEQVRLVTSGTEATMSAIRLARGYTGRDQIVKFEGCYHGHVDGLLVKAGSGALTLGEPDSAGVPKAYSELTSVLTYNDADELEKYFVAHGDDTACVIIEPVAGNMNCVPPSLEFLQSLRELCTQYSVVLIFDEVMTGFRVALGGAQSLFGVTPDLTTLGKVIGGGLPVGAFGGKREIMDMIAPNGPVYQAGTLAGNPLAVAAGLAMLEAVSEPGFYEELDIKAQQLAHGLTDRAQYLGIPFRTNQVGGMFGCFFTTEPSVSSFAEVMQCNTENFQSFFHTMLVNGIYLAPSPYEAGFISAAHGNREIQATLYAAEVAFNKLDLSGY
jgi:glutamate-1-semialdehyde 2,1-aminomutase